MPERPFIINSLGGILGEKSIDPLLLEKQLPHIEDHCAMVEE